MTKQLPVVLVIDDQPEKVALQRDRPDMKLRAVHPAHLTEEDISEADLVLVDHVLDHWTFADGKEPPYACRPADGVALAGIVRAHLRSLSSSPSALALYSGELDKLTLDAEPQEHLISMTFGLEWAFTKTQKAGVPDLNDQVAALARAVKSLPRKWISDDPDELARQMERLLAIDGRDWSARAFVEVERCRPPVHQLSEWTSGVAVLRWLLHRVLPYPCLLLDRPQLALRLRVPLEWLTEQLGKDQPLRAAIEPARYTGALAGFLGDRWWWAGCDAAIREAIGKAPTSIQQLHGWLHHASGADVPLLDLQQPVLTFDGNGQFQSIVAMSDCVRIQPDNWPSYADEPWCKKEDARRDPMLKRLVVSADLDVISDDGAGA